jgi:hypothetical protein
VSHITPLLAFTQLTVSPTIMSVNPIATTLMPLSQAVSWYLVLNQPLLPSLSKISTFYCAWALYKKIAQGDQKELGHISMGILAVTSYSGKRYASLAGTVLVLANFLLPAYYVFSWSVEKVAEKLKKDVTNKTIKWAYIFKAYFVSNLALWGMVCYKLSQGELLPGVVVAT